MGHELTPTNTTCKQIAALLELPVRLAETGGAEDEGAAVLGDEAQGGEVRTSCLETLGLKLQSNSSSDLGGGICLCFCRRQLGVGADDLRPG
jgi:hypothetical protein